MGGAIALGAVLLVAHLLAAAPAIRASTHADAGHLTSPVTAQQSGHSLMPEADAGAALCCHAEDRGHHTVGHTVCQSHAHHCCSAPIGLPVALTRETATHVPEWSIVRARAYLPHRTPPPRC